MTNGATEPQTGWRFSQPALASIAAAAALFWFKFREDQISSTLDQHTNEFREVRRELADGRRDINDNFKELRQEIGAWSRSFSARVDSVWAQQTSTPTSTHKASHTTHSAVGAKDGAHASSCLQPVMAVPHGFTKAGTVCLPWCAQDEALADILSRCWHRGPGQGRRRVASVRPQCQAQCGWAQWGARTEARSKYETTTTN